MNKHENINSGGVHALLITNEGQIILQQRDDKPGIAGPGRIGLFGGQLENSENLEEGLRRELLEELNLEIVNQNCEFFGRFYKTKEIDGIDWIVNVFLINNVNLRELDLNEGTNFVIGYPEELLKNERITRIVKVVLEKYVQNY